jgi:ABC-type multidrug transport system fused ATPase/permease subunit
MVTTSRLVLRVLSYVRPYVRNEAEIALCMLVGVGLSILDPLIVKVLIDRVLVARLSTLLNALMVGLLILALVRGAFQVISCYLYSFVGERILLDVRVGLFRHLERMHAGFFSTRRTGDLLSRLTHDSRALQNLAGSAVVTALTDLLMVLGITAVILFMNWRLTLLALLVVPPFVWVVLAYGGRVRLESRRVMEGLADVTSHAQEVLGRIAVVQGYVREDQEARRLEEYSEELIRRELRLALLGGGTGAVVGLLGALGPLLVLWCGGHLVMGQSMSLGTLVALWAYAGRLFAPIHRLASLNLQVQGAVGAADRIFELLDRQPEIRDRPGALQLANVQGRIEFHDVWFCYRPEKPVLTGLHMRIDPGEVVALVGSSGAGKTTVASLLCRFYEPQQGAVLIDGHDVRTLALASLREQVAVVSREAGLFHASIRDNIAYGQPGANMAEIARAAKGARVDEFVADLPQRYETLVGEQGVRLSGGQQQRVAIARAILKDPRILVLDEAMAALDSESEALIHSALGRLMRGRTTLIIAHRLSTALRADRILVLDGGRIVQEGCHEHLYQECETYRRLFDEQVVA